jgi:hypothetical protein
MSGSPDDLALEAISEALRRAHHRPAACAALMRLSGQALARLTSDDQACRVHAELARRHAQRSARCGRA